MESLEVAQGIGITAARPGDLRGRQVLQVFRHTADIGKAKRVLGWEPRIRLDEGLDMTIEWYAKNRSWWEKQLWMREVPIIVKGGKTVVH